MDIKRYNSLNEKLRIALKENCKEEADIYREEMDELFLK